MDRSGENAHRITRRQVGDDGKLVAHLLLVKKAAALANVQAGGLTKTEGDLIATACKRLKEKSHEFTADLYSGGGSVLINVQLNALISEESGVDISKVNLSQSTADVVATALRIHLQPLLADLIASLTHSASLMRQLAVRLGSSPSMARTCLQDAMPTTLDVLFIGAASVIERRAKRLFETGERLLAVSLGGTVIGDGQGASRTYQEAVIGILAGESKLALVPRESFLDAAQNSDGWGELNRELDLLATCLIKICNDQRLMASGPEHGFQEICLPQVIPGSSFFGPKKNNPTIPETVIQACFLVLGRSRTAQAALEHGELHLNVFESTAAFSAFESITFLSNALQVWNQHCLPGIAAFSPGDKL